MLPAPPRKCEMSGTPPYPGLLDAGDRAMSALLLAASIGARSALGINSSFGCRQPGVVLLEFRRRRDLAFLHHQATKRWNQVTHVDGGALLRSQKCGGENDVADVAARQRKLFGEKLEIHIGRQWSLRGKHSAPEALAMRRI